MVAPPPLAHAIVPVEPPDRGELANPQQRLVWSPKEDAMILQMVEELGQRWRKIAAMLPTKRTDDAVRNRWHRLMEQNKSQVDKEAGGLTAGDDGERQSVYKCSRCGQPKKAHVCTMPEVPISAQHRKGASSHSSGGTPQGGGGTGGGEAAAELRTAWTAQEDDIILRYVAEFGPKWTEIAIQLSGRTEHAARNRFHRLIQRNNGVNPFGTFTPGR